MSESEFNLEELHRQIDVHFEIYKEELSGEEHSGVNSLLDKVNMASDLLLYKVKYVIDEFMNAKVKEAASPEIKSAAIGQKKSECLIRLQTLTSEVACQILNDYKKMTEEKNPKLVSK